MAPERSHTVARNSNHKSMDDSAVIIPRFLPGRLVAFKGSMLSPLINFAHPSREIDTVAPQEITIQRVNGGGVSRGAFI